MDCDLARQLIEDGSEGADLASHLSRCPECRREAVFTTQVALAVAALPRVQAPEGLFQGVMTVLASQSPEARRARHRLPFLLRSWELGWIGFACLALVAGVSPLLRYWPAAGFFHAVAVALVDDVSRVQIAFGSMTSGALARGWIYVERSVRLTVGRSGGEHGTWAIAAGAILVFAVSLALLLTCCPSGAPTSRREDARA
jgi:hypothetical protein